MNYLISEDEYNRLHSVQCQLNMMAQLCGCMTGFDTSCKPGDLGEFFEAQQSALDEVRKAVDHRHEVSSTVDKPMHWFDWLAVIEIASGDYVPLHPERVQHIDDALSHLETLDPSYGPVVKKWGEVSARHAKTRRQAQGLAATDKAEKSTQEKAPPASLSIALFADLMRVVSGQAMEVDKVNDTVVQFLAVFDEQPADQALLMQAVFHALMHNGYEHSQTVSKSGRHAQWARKAVATAPDTATAPTVGKQRKRARTANKAKGTATTHMAERATA